MMYSLLSIVSIDVRPVLRESIKKQKEGEEEE